MEPNEKVEQRRVVVDSPGERREIVTERSESAPRESGISAGMVAIIAIVAIFAVGAIVYFVSSKNANESANRNANLEAASQTNNAQPPATTIVQQPAAPAPVIIQQPAAAQQAPVIIQQPAQASRDTASDDANMQEVATKRLTEEPGMTSVSISISNAQAVLIGSVNSAATKAKAERLVRAIRGVKSVDNQIVVFSG
jgi:flagellar basal body-associated protein FliL